LPANRQFRYFTFHIKTGAIAGESNNNKRIDISGTLEGEFGSRLLLGKDDNPAPDTKLNPPGSFIHPNLLNFFTSKPENSTVLWGSLFSITLTISTEGDGAKLSLRFIKVFGHDTNGEIVELMHNNYELEPGGELHITQKAALIIPINRPPLPAPPPEVPIEELEDKARARELVDHLGYHDSFYNRVVLLQADPVALSKSFQAKPWFSGQTLAEHVDPIPLEVFGGYVAYPLAKQPLQITDQALIVELAASLNSSDPARQQWAQGKLDSLTETLTEAERADVVKNIALASSRSERLITLPTRGVFAEGKLGHCNISEEIDNTRFWKWEEHPIPIEAPGINPVTPIQPQPQQVNATPTAFPQPLVNIVNPSPAPDPTGLTAALSLLGTPNIFRDMSGRQEVADLLKKLSDNTIAIADAANRARGIQAKYGSAEGAVAPTGDTGQTTGSRGSSSQTQGQQKTPEQKEVEVSKAALDVAKESLPPEKRKLVEDAAAKKLEKVASPGLAAIDVIFDFSYELTGQSLDGEFSGAFINSNLTELIDQFQTDKGIGRSRVSLPPGDYTVVLEGRRLGLPTYVPRTLTVPAVGDSAAFDIDVSGQFSGGGERLEGRDTIKVKQGVKGMRVQVVAKEEKKDTPIEIDTSKTQSIKAAAEFVISGVIQKVSSSLGVSGEWEESKTNATKKTINVSYNRLLGGLTLTQRA